ncbi:hypothetical protein [Winogradskyella pulchriflava]|uniref:Lipoprotein n=1 Tax=Winogradskyella pulchriflava TaxID=1110688 RepID=A0ABV6Q3T0_9FLAO
MKRLLLLFVFACFLTSCNVTESIVFNKDMGGEYTSSFDLSPMMNYANSNRPSSVERPAKEKIDTTIVFNDLFETHKDSIAALSADQRERMEKLRGMVMDMHMNEEEGVFEFHMTKPFVAFEELKSITEQVDDALDVAKGVGNSDGQAPEGQLDELTKTDKITYSFDNNTFSRYHPELPETSDLEDDMDEEEDGYEEEESDMAKQFEMQFEEIFSTAYYTLVYKFPRKVKSVSQIGAVISEDGKTVTYRVAMSDMHKNNTLMNIDVVLED